MLYQVKVEALRRWFCQETNTNNALQKLASLKRGTNQTVTGQQPEEAGQPGIFLQGLCELGEGAMHTLHLAFGEDLQLRGMEQG